MPAWEYKIEVFRWGGQTSEFYRQCQTVLNAQGRDGWENYHVEKVAICAAWFWFKRINPDKVPRL